MENKVNQIENLELDAKSEEIQDLMNQPSHWILKWGNIFFLLVTITALIIFCSWKYSIPIEGYGEIISNGQFIDVAIHDENLINRILSSSPQKIRMNVHSSSPDSMNFEGPITGISKGACDRSINIKVNLVETFEKGKNNKVFLCDGDSVRFQITVAEERLINHFLGFGRPK